MKIIYYFKIMKNLHSNSLPQTSREPFIATPYSSRHPSRTYQIRTYYSNSITLTFLILMVQTISGQVAPAISSSSLKMENLIHSKQSTKYDGVNQDGYVSYHTLDGNSGYSIKLANIAANTSSQNIDYAIMLWFKPMETLGVEWNTIFQYVFAYNSNFQCYFTEQKSLICESSMTLQKLQVSTEGLHAEEWYHLTVSGSSLQGSYLLLEKGSSTIELDSSSYLNLSLQSSNNSFCLGFCDPQYGLRGGVRDFTVIQSYLTPGQAKIVKNNYLTWDFKILAYYRFSEKSLSQDEFRLLKAEQLGQPLLQRDFISNDICYPFPNFSQFQYFSGNRPFENYTFNDRIQFSSFNYSYTLSLWVKPDSDHCYAQSYIEAENSCKLVHFYESFMLYFDSQSSVRVRFYSDLNYYEQNSLPLLIPQNSWVNIQLVFNQFYGYKLESYDLQGRLMQSVTEVKNLQTQKPKRILELFPSYKGLARSFILVSKYMNTPYQPSINDFISDNSFLFYFKFQKEFQGTGTTLKNYGNNRGWTQDLMLRTGQGFVYQPAEFYDSVGEGLTQRGSIEGKEVLFDGIACNDSSQVLYLLEKSSFLSAQLPPINSSIQSATVEFWLKPFDLDHTFSIFSLYSPKYNIDFLSVFADLSKSIVCAPFGADSFRNPMLTYQNMTSKQIQALRWFHLTCSFKIQDQLVGYLASSTEIEDTYSQSLESVSLYIPADNFTMYLGNSGKDTNKGSQFMRFKELRLWNYQRSFNEIKSWRYRSLNPLTSIGSDMLLYFKLNQGNFMESNFLSVIGGDQQVQFGQMNNLSYSADTSLLICPQFTYFFKQICYHSPFTFILPTVFPVIDSSLGLIGWNFTLRHSSMIDSAFKLSEVQQIWSSSDSLLANALSTPDENGDIIVDSSFLADQRDYPTEVYVTNRGYTFSESYSFNFVPNHCQWAVVEDSNDAFSTYNLIQDPKSQKDLTFNIKVQSPPACASFYDELNAVKYYYSPSDVLNLGIPLLRFTTLDSSTIQVTLPKEEQFKLPTLQDIKIVIELQWTNSKYSSLIVQSDSVFQHILYTFNYGFEHKTVVPSLTTNFPYALRGTDIVLDGSQSYVTMLPDSQKYSDLNFFWNCPPPLDQICSGQNQNTLTIPYSSFVTSGALFNQTYNLQMQIIWTDTITYYFYSSAQVTWYDIQDPEFIIQSPVQVFNSLENQFNITFKNYDQSNMQGISISWSIIPNISITSSSFLNLSKQNTSLLIGPQGLKPSTTYNLSVTAYNSSFPIARKFHYITFKTSFPPNGGRASISPSKGYYGYTRFTISLSGWDGAQPPLIYQVWQTSDSTGTVLLNQLTDWMSVYTSFTFTATSANPFVVVVTDGTGEVAYSDRLVISLLSIPKQASLKIQEGDFNNNQAVVMEEEYLNQLNALVGLQVVNQTALTQLLDSFITNEMFVEEIMNRTQVSMQASFLCNVTKKIVNLSNEHLNSLTQITKNISILPIFSPELLNDTQFIQDFSLILSYLFQMSQSNADYSQRKQINQQLNQVLKNLEAGLTNYNISQPKVIKTPSFSLSQNRFAKNSSVDSLSLALANNSQIIVNVQKFLSQAKQFQNLDSDSFYIKAISFKYDQPLQSLLSPLQQYSPILQVDITDQKGESVQKTLSVQDYVEIYFSIKQDSFVQNQTVCFQRQTQGSPWQSDLCLTKISALNKTVFCFCKMGQNTQFALLTDLSRTPSLDENENYQNPSQNLTSIIPEAMNEASYLILILLGVLGILVPLLLFTLDESAFKLSELNSSAYQKSPLLQKIQLISQIPVQDLAQEHDKIIGYTLVSPTMLSHMMRQMHPFVDVISNTKMRDNRLNRFSRLYFKICLFALVSILAFAPKSIDQDPTQCHSSKLFDGASYLNFKSFLTTSLACMEIPFDFQVQVLKILEESSKIARNQQDISLFAMVIIGGMFFIQPWPDLRFFSAPSGQVIQEQESKQSASTTKSNALPEFTVTASLDLNSYRVDFPSTRSVTEAEPSSIRSKSTAKESLKMKILVILNFSISIICIGLFTYYSQTDKNFASNSEMMGHSFAFGILGSIIIINPVRIVLEYLSVRKEGAKRGCLVSEEARRIQREILVVREAYKAINLNRQEQSYASQNTYFNTQNEDVYSQRSEGSNKVKIPSSEQPKKIGNPNSICGIEEEYKAEEIVVSPKRENKEQEVTVLQSHLSWINNYKSSMEEANAELS